MSNSQSTLFKGIYEFEDPSGTLLAAKVPAVGTVDLYDGTAVVVKPNQCAVFVYNGQVADVLLAGTHYIKTGNLPVLTRLANWKFGFESPLRCELIFMSGQMFTSRRWGTPQPILVNVKDVGSIPMRAFGNFSLVIQDPRLFFAKLFGTRSTYSIIEVEELVQGYLAEALPGVLHEFGTLEAIIKSYSQVSKKLESALLSKTSELGLRVQNIQVLSAMPTQEVIEAMEAKAAINIIGSQKEYLLYKAASGMGAAHDSAANDPMQMMMGLMLGKGLIGAEPAEKEALAVPLKQKTCPGCTSSVAADSNFCPQCGKKV